MDVKAGTLDRGEISEQSQWDLSGLYSSNEEWNKDLELLEGDIPKYDGYRDTLSQSFVKLKECLEFDMNFSRRLEKLYTFAHLKNDEDKTNSFYQGNFEKSMRLLNEAGKASSFIRPEIMAIPEEQIDQFLEEKEIEFSEKIDELNQETDTLLEEIDKWQM